MNKIKVQKVWTFLYCLAGCVLIVAHLNSWQIGLGIWLVVGAIINAIDIKAKR